VCVCVCVTHHQVEHVAALQTYRLVSRL